MSRAGEIDRFLEDGFPAPPSPLPLPGLPAVARKASGRRMTRRHNKRAGTQDVVGGGNGGGDSGDGSWSLEIGGAPSSMPGTAAPATVPAPGGFDDADDTRMAVGGGRGEGSGSRRSGGAAVNDGATAAAASAVAAMTTTTL
jgi:hypothetical protein